jgi:AcrR family transcriptional regulator
MVNKLIRRPSQLHALLDAAIGLVAEQGVAALTVERLAQAAGMTKGGVQYHFRTKDALVIALLDYLIDGFDAEIDALAGEGAEGGEWLAAYVKVSLGESGPEMAFVDGVALALIAAMAPDDPCAEPFKAATQRWRERAERGVRDKPLAQLIRLAADAVWLERTHAGIERKVVDALRARLLQFARELK